VSIYIVHSRKAISNALSTARRLFRTIVGFSGDSWKHWDSDSELSHVSGSSVLAEATSFWATFLYVSSSTVWVACSYVHHPHSSTFPSHAGKTKDMLYSRRHLRQQSSRLSASVNTKSLWHIVYGCLPSGSNHSRRRRRLLPSLLGMKQMSTKDGSNTGDWPLHNRCSSRSIFSSLIGSRQLRPHSAVCVRLLQKVGTS